VPRIKVPVPQQPLDEPKPTEVMEAPAQANKRLPRLSSGPWSERLAKERLVLGAIALGFLVLIIMLFSLMSERNELKEQVTKLSGSSADSGAEEVKRITREISRTFQLPTGETPTLATVTDATKVRAQAFFHDAQNGDKVLLYSKAGQAILYRPSTKKIIAVAPVNLNGSGSSNSGGTTSSGATSTTN
jgi:hypothetical protein